jgi:hypothetical protein
LRRIAERQLNLVTRKQAQDAEVSTKQLRNRAARGILKPLYDGVYLFGAGEPTFEQDVLAAVLACGAGAFVTSFGAAALWKVVDAAPKPFEVAVPFSGRKSAREVDVRRSRRVGKAERTMLGLIPTATIGRTLLDLAASAAEVELERAVDAALRQKLTDPSRLLAYLEGRAAPNSGALRKIARDRLRYGAHETAFERDTERVLLSYGLPRPLRQVPYNANGRSVRFDLFYPEQRVAIEPNGESPHWGRDRWQADHDKRIAARLAGIDMLEFTWDDVHRRQLYVVTTVGDALGLKPSRWVPR